MLLSKRVTAVLSASLLTLACQAALAADSLNFVSWGGTTQDAQKEAWAVPFTKATNIKVVQDGPTDYGKLKAMVESGNVQWDVVDVEADFALRAASEGLLEPSTSTRSSATRSTHASSPTMASAHSSSPSCSATTKASSGPTSRWTGPRCSTPRPTPASEPCTNGPAPACWNWPCWPTA